MDGQTDGSTDGWMDGWMGGWTDVSVQCVLELCVPVSMNELFFSGAFIGP